MVDKVLKQGFLQTVRFSSYGYHSALLTGCSQEGLYVLSGTYLGSGLFSDLCVLKSGRFREPKHPAAHSTGALVSSGSAEWRYFKNTLVKTNVSSTLYYNVFVNNSVHRLRRS